MRLGISEHDERAELAGDVANFLFWERTSEAEISAAVVNGGDRGVLRADGAEPRK